MKSITSRSLAPPLQLLADLVAQVHRQRRVGVRQRLVLAHQAAQLVGEPGDALVQRRVLCGARRERREAQGEAQGKASPHARAP